MPKIPKTQKIPKNEIVGKRILLESSSSLAKSKNKITNLITPKIKTMTKSQQKR